MSTTKKHKFFFKKCAFFAASVHYKRKEQPPTAAEPNTHRPSHHTHARQGQTHPRKPHPPKRQKYHRRAKPRQRQDSGRAHATPADQRGRSTGQRTCKGANVPRDALNAAGICPGYADDYLEIASWSTPNLDPSYAGLVLSE